MITITKTEHGYSAVRTKDKTTQKLRNSQPNHTTMKTTQHTPGKHTELPWAMDYNRNEDRYQLHGKSSFGHFQGWSADGVTTFEEDKANAQFIVTACNSHYELLEACRMALADESTSSKVAKVCYAAIANAGALTPISAQGKE